jgi:hypothetical protein
MHTTMSGPQVWERWRESKRLALLATFEDSVTGMRVKEFCQDLSRHLGEQCQIVEHVWLLSTLRFRELQEIAAEEASAADLIIISFHDAASLPDEVKGWINLWLRQRGTRKAVLLALLDPADEEAPGAVEAYLQEVARKGGMEFLVESRTMPEARWRGR